MWHILLHVPAEYSFTWHVFSKKELTVTEIMDLYSRICRENPSFDALIPPYFIMYEKIDEVDENISNMYILTRVIRGTNTIEKMITNRPEKIDYIKSIKRTSFSVMTKDRLIQLLSFLNQNNAQYEIYSADNFHIVAVLNHNFSQEQISNIRRKYFDLSSVHLNFLNMEIDAAYHKANLDVLANVVPSKIIYTITDRFYEITAKIAKTIHAKMSEENLPRFEMDIGKIKICRNIDGTFITAEASEMKNITCELIYSLIQEKINEIIKNKNVIDIYKMVVPLLPNLDFKTEIKGNTVYIYPPSDLPKEQLESLMRMMIGRGGENVKRVSEIMQMRITIVRPKTQKTEEELLYERLEEMKRRLLG